MIHARWVEFGRRGLRACIVTNVGSPGRGRVATVLPSQVVAVFLPEAAVGHLLQPARVWSTPDPCPHIVLSARSTSSRMTGAVTAGLPVDPRFWHRRDGQFATELTGPHGFRFASCIDGVLYARSETRKLDLSAALAAVDELVALAQSPWHPPTESEIARQRALSVAYLDRSRRVRKIALIALVGYAVGGGLIRWCSLHGR